MKLIEAHEMLRTPARGGKPFSVFLACGFNSLHLTTFLAAHLRLMDGSLQPQITSGLFDDFEGNIARLTSATRDVGIVAIEWPDLDRRLGLRSLGGWSPDRYDEILQGVNARCAQLQQALSVAAEAAPLIVSFPTLPLPPIGFTTSFHASVIELELNSAVASLAANLGRNPNIRVASRERLDGSSPGPRLDVNADLSTGFPYTLPHASALAALFCELAYFVPPKKGLITDLDGTLWRGTLGEAGVDGIAWDLEHDSQMHGLYQQILQSLSQTGVLIGVASKNDPTLVEQAFRRRDLMLSATSVYPLEVNWRPKSHSVARILTSWNVSADSVVYVDDSMMELAEVRTRFPAIECIPFPRRNADLLDFLQRLRDLFGKPAVLEEDLLRTRSIANAVFTNRDNNEEDQLTASDFLQQAEAELTLILEKEPRDRRALELINKTNQFNLNGRRFTEAEWLRHLNQDDGFCVVVSYKDKYGPLGRIAVIAGRQERRLLTVDVWVMSCRAFSRDIEHQCLKQLFESFPIDEVNFDFIPTGRNAPMSSFLDTVCRGSGRSDYRLSRTHFAAHQRALFHRVVKPAAACAVTK